MKFIIRENIIPFTNFNLVLFALCYFKPFTNYVSYDYLYSINYSWNHIIFFTFNGAYFIDNTSFKRMAIRKNLSLPSFHIMNIILHNLPFIYVNVYIPTSFTLYHSSLGCLIMLLWCYWATFRTFDFDYIYVYMKKQDQIKLYIIIISSIFYAPLIYHSNKYIRTVLLLM